MKDLKKKNILKFEQLRWRWQTSEFNILLLAWQTSVKMIGVSGSGRTEGNSTKSSFHYHRQRRYVGISCLYINQPPTVCRSIRRMSEDLSTRRARPLTPPCSADRNHGWRHCREQSFTPPTTDHTQTPPSHLQIHKRDRAATDRLLSRRSRSVSLMYYFISQRHHQNRQNHYSDIFIILIIIPGMESPKSSTFGGKKHRNFKC